MSPQKPLLAEPIALGGGLVDGLWGDKSHHHRLSPASLCVRASSLS